jgi:hypothetical protein
VYARLHEHRLGLGEFGARGVALRAGSVALRAPAVLRLGRCDTARAQLHDPRQLAVGGRERALGARNPRGRCGAPVLRLRDQCGEPLVVQAQNQIAGRNVRAFRDRALDDRLRCFGDQLYPVALECADEARLLVFRAGGDHRSHQGECESARSHRVSGSGASPRASSACTCAIRRSRKSSSSS